MPKSRNLKDTQPWMTKRLSGLDNFWKIYFEQ